MTLDELQQRLKTATGNKDQAMATANYWAGQVDLLAELLEQAREQPSKVAPKPKLEAVSGG